MAIYDATKGAGAINQLDFHRMFCARIPIVVADIIAADATLTANAKITAADVIQLWDVPALTVLYPCFAFLKIVTAGTAGGTVNVGIAGSTEMFSGVSTATADVIHSVEDSATWGTDNYGGYEFETTDTIDMTFVADETVGSFLLFIPGCVSA